jgi:hypothetical protein
VLPVLGIVLVIILAVGIWEIIRRTRRRAAGSNTT